MERKELAEWWEDRLMAGWSSLKDRRRSIESGMGVASARSELAG